MAKERRSALIRWTGSGPGLLAGGLWVAAAGRERDEDGCTGTVCMAAKGRDAPRSLA